VSQKHILPDLPETPTGEKEPHPLRKHLLLAAKFIIMIGVFWLVFNKIDVDKLSSHLKNIPIIYIVLAIIFLNAAQLTSGLRMKYYFASIDHKFNILFSVTLYYVGAFYSIILPGGISGDGYKAYILKKIRNIPVKSSLRLVICERANGLFMLCFLALFYAVFSNGKNITEHGNLLIILGFIILIPSYFISAKIILRDPVKVALGASKYSFSSQIFVSLCAASLFMGIGIEMSNMADYLVIFMISSIMSILPISVGSAGVREATFLYIIEFLNREGFESLNVEIGVAAALAYFGVHVITSLVGIFFLNKLDKYSKHS